MSPNYADRQQILCIRRFVELFACFTYVVLIISRIVLLSFTLLELDWLVVEGLIDESAYRLDILDLFGYFLLIPIGPEPMETIKAYLDSRELLVAIIVIAREVTPLGSATAGELIGSALIVIALCGDYYLIRRAGLPHALPPDDGVLVCEGREEP